MKLSVIVIQQSYKPGSKSYILSPCCIKHCVPFSILFGYRSVCRFKSIHSHQSNKTWLALSQKKKDFKVVIISTVQKLNTKLRFNIISALQNKNHLLTHSFRYILHITVETYTMIWAPKIKSVASVLSNITTVTTYLDRYCATGRSHFWCHMCH